MTGWRRLTVVLLVGSCATGSGGGTNEVAPAPAAPATPATPAAPPTPEKRPPSGTVRYGPSAMRYLVYRQLHIEQTFGGKPQRQDLGARVFVSVVITGPADSIGYPATFTVDSVLADSGTPQPIADNMSKVRALILAGRVAPRGDFQGSSASDSMGAQNMAQIVGNFRDFLPRVPVQGVKSGTSWSDTLSVAQRSGGGAVTRRAIVHSRVAGWEDHAGTRSLHIESNATYSLTGSGENGGQSFQVSGTGTTTSRAFIAEDGRYLGGESQDSTSLTVTLPAQGLTIPVTQVLHSSVVVKP